MTEQDKVHQCRKWFGCPFGQEMVIAMEIMIMESRKEKRVIQSVQVRTHFLTPTNTTEAMNCKLPGFIYIYISPNA